VFVDTGISKTAPSQALSDPSCSFARTWLNELKGRNIRVNVLSPGGQVDTLDSQRLDKETS